MRALILAGGYSTRLGTLTKNLPKPLIEVSGKPILQHIIDRLNLHGINEIIINTHYLPVHINKAIETRALYYHVPRLLGHKGTIYALKDWIGDDFFFVINGDTLSNVNYTEMWNMRNETQILALMDENRCAGTWLYPKLYLQYSSLSIQPYRPEDLIWHDVGDRKRLKEARAYYDNKVR
jgi:NDP-sugar pyrophosphorylase family protein